MLENIERIARNETASVVRFRRSIETITSVIIPLGIAVWIGFAPKLSESSELLFWIVLAFLGIFQAILFYEKLRGPQTTQEVYFHAKDLAKDNEELRESLNSIGDLAEQLEIVSNACIAWRVMVREYFNWISIIREDFQNIIEEIFSLLINNMDTIFRFEPGELWSFAVYIYDPRDDKLKPVWRDKHRRHPAEGPAREWPPGQGHVGVAFERKEPIFHMDATEPEVAKILDPPPPLRRAYDSAAYRSIVSIPIGPVHPADPDERPLGVVVATSNKPARFDERNIVILRHAAGTLANLIHIKQIESATLVG